MYLFFDTETSGIPDFKLAASHPLQARIIQFACLLCDDKFGEVACFSTLIRPSTDFTIAEGAFKAHGISIEDCRKYGVPINTVMSLFNNYYYMADKVIAHNISFDSQLIDIEETLLFSKPRYDWSNDEKHLCTMRVFTPICNLFNPKYPSKPKWPKLQEAYKHCYGKEFSGAHDALADVRATASIYRWYLEHYSKPVEVVT